MVKSAVESEAIRKAHRMVGVMESLYHFTLLQSVSGHLLPRGMISMLVHATAVPIVRLVPTIFASLGLLARTKLTYSIVMIRCGTDCIAPVTKGLAVVITTFHGLYKQLMREQLKRLILKYVWMKDILTKMSQLILLKYLLNDN